MVGLDPEFVLQADKTVNQLRLLALEEVVDAIDLIEEAVHPFDCKLLSVNDLVVALTRFHIVQVLLVKLGDELLDAAQRLRVVVDVRFPQRGPP